MHQQACALFLSGLLAFSQIALAEPPASPTAAPAAASPAADTPTSGPLYDTVAALDTAVFDAFSHCSAPDQLEKYAAYFSPDVEFYHDNAGVTWDRQVMIANTAKNACGHYSRELVAGSLKVYPIHDFGAIAQGVHRFCHFGSGRCEGLAEFVIVWRLKDGKWEITRALSYGHRSSE